MTEQAIAEPKRTLRLSRRMLGLLGGLLLVAFAGLSWRMVQNRRNPSGNFPLAAVAPGILGSAEVGKPAPDFQIAYPDGRVVKLSQLRGQTVLINFWATWCGPCRVETPDIIRVYQARRNDKFTVIAVNLEESDEQVQSFVDEFQMPYPVVRDAQGIVAKAYGVRGLPLSVFVNPQGNITLRYAGAMTLDTIENALVGGS